MKNIRHSCDMEILLKQKNKSKKLIMVARLDNEFKRFDLAIKAMKKLPEFTLDIFADRVGGEQELNMLKNLAIENKIDNVFLEEVRQKYKKN